MSKYVTFISWEDAVHLTKEQKESLVSGIPPWARDSRTKGIPTIGAGSIYTVPESDFVITPIPLQKHWHRAYGFDVGWKINAAVFAAVDRDTEVVYIYDEIYKAQTEPAIMAAAIKARGEWVPGVIDYAGSSIKDGEKVMTIYRDLGLDIRPAVKSVEAGILNVWEMLVEGRLKVFNTCQNLLAEYRLYRRDEKGQIVKSNDHALDALRYLLMNGTNRAIQAPIKTNGPNWYDWAPKYNIFAG